MKKIIRIEDITEIVGMKNYIEALSLNKDNLNYLGCDIGQNRLNFNFKYENNTIKISIDKKNNIKELKCNCETNNLNYCKHIALALMFLMSNNIIEENLEKLNSSYDEDFNNLLFNSLNNIDNNKIKLKLEVILKKLEDSYELKLKIGETTTYMLNKNIREFFESYNNKEGYVEYGKNFIYNPHRYYFDEIDQKIIEFVNLYIDSQIPRYGYYNYYEAISKIILTDKSLKEFLKLLDEKTFNVEKGYYNYTFEGINNFDIPIDIKDMKDSIKIDFDYNDYINFTSDYTYMITKNKMVKLLEKEAKLIKLLISNNKKQIVLKNNELNVFSNLIYPILKDKKTLKMDQVLRDKFVSKPLEVKYYFDYNNEIITCSIKLNYNNFLIDINDDNNNFDGVYISRNKEDEIKYINEITDIGFVYDIKKNNYYLTGENIVEFLETYLKIISSKYETYISKNLKKTNVIKKTSITNTFKLGKNNILTYEFEIDNIDKKELSNILVSIKENKKYYKLKNGNFLYLKNEELNKLSGIINNLNITEKQIKQDSIELPIYKTLILGDMLEDKFIKIDNNIKKVLENFNEYKNSEIILDKKDMKILRDYQYIGVKWMNIISKCGFGGILADEMGLGKSIQAINYLKINKGKTLIVVPTSLIYNWENEFNKFGKGIKFTIINGIKSDRINKLQDFNNYDVFITSYGLLRNDIKQYLKYEFNNLIVDEAQNIKNITSDTTKTVKMIKAKTKFALTGTPIENSILELWSIMDFIMPNFLLPINEFRKIYNVKNIEQQACLERLNKQISPFILRRKKKDVLEDLPDKIENNIMIDLNDEQKKLYLAELNKTKEEIDKLIKNNEVNKSSFLILSLLTKLRQICIDPKLIFDNNIESSKLETLLEILNNVKDEHKILIFSQFPSALKLIIPKLKSNKISYYYLDGSTKSEERINLVNKFNNDETNVFLISLKAGGTGLNLTSADIVIHYDPWWNPQVENQATDRSHRIGQNKVVEVIKLIAKGTIEEKIIELQNRKKKLSDKIIEGDNRDNITLSKLDEKQLKEIMNI